MTDPEYGQTVTTRDGKVGVVLEYVRDGTLKFHEHRGYRNKRTVLAHAVLLESGEIRFYAADALRDPNEGSSEISRSGALK